MLSRSNLARINEDKPYTLYEALFGKLLARCQPKAPGHGFRFKNKLYSLDASTIDLCLNLFPWAKFRTTKGAVKLHVGLDHQGYLPTFVTITDGKTSDIVAGRCMDFPAHSIVVCDRGYNDYDWFKQLTDKGIYLITRLKKNVKIRIVKRLYVAKHSHICSDQIIEFTGVKARKKCPIRLRRIGYRDPETKKNYIYITNNFSLSSQTVADIYKKRWGIELFFKWIKQNLKIKKFLGTSKNTVMTQIWIAMYVYLLLCFMKFESKLNKSMQQLIRLLQINLMERSVLTPLLICQVLVGMVVIEDRKRPSTPLF